MQFSNRTKYLLHFLNNYFHKTKVNSVPIQIVRYIQTGDKISIIREVTNEDVMDFAQLTDDFNPIHVSAKKKIVHGALLNGFLSGVLGTKLPGPGTIVIEQYINYPKPCYVGDTIEISVEVLSARKIIKCGYKLNVINSERVVLEGEVISCIQNVQSTIGTTASSIANTTEQSMDCMCGIFLSGSFKKGSKEQPTENTTLIHEPPTKVPCTLSGKKLCTKQCLDIVLRNMHNSSEHICHALNRDAYREKAYLFIKICKDKWINTNLSGTRHYCCKDGHPRKCFTH